MTQFDDMEETSMEQQNKAIEIPQYSLGKILLIWAAAAAPMGVLGWLVGPGLARSQADVPMARLGGITVGLIWQFVLVLILLRREGSNLRWADVRQRLWLVAPSDAAGRTDRRLWWWLIPLILVEAVFALMLSGMVEGLWVKLLPFFAEPPSFSMAGFMGSPESRAALVGNWGLFLLFLVQMFFNTVIGEELLFRGLLLPRMAAAFGKRDWLANGILFGLYHWHQPWGMLGSIIDGALLYAFPTKRFRSAWFGIAVHSGQSVYFAFLLLGLVLGLAK
ncbi:MAG TPA: CPBP family intramembrane glutamic endopeptidase [Anaerolineales bacterium]|nr:CPBP family intramembrane glutamic endopeptidase [Anaerolineales bacterium]